jgi:hypothetical protein
MSLIHRVVFFVLAMSLLVSCGGGSDSEDSPPAANETVVYWDCGGAAGIGLFFTWLAGGCARVEVSTQEQVPDSPEIIPDTTVTSWRLSSQNEREPNDSFDEAHQIFFSGANAMRINGSVNEMTDPRDHFVFGVEVSDFYGIYLCQSQGDCSDFLFSQEIHLELYDQNRVLIQTTEAVANNRVEMAETLTPGLGYYVVIVRQSDAPVDEAMPYTMIITQ